MLFLLTVEDVVQQEKIIYVYQSQYSRMAYTVGKYLHSREDIEDAVHESMLRLIGIIDRVETDDPVRLKNLCCVVAKNVAINKARKDSRKILPLEEVFDMTDTDTPNPEETVIENDIMAVLISAIDSLNDTYRDVCRLRYINELREKEIAQLLDLPEKTVNQRIFRGKQILKKALAKEKING